MANDRTIKTKGDAAVSGELIANRLKLRGSRRVVHPPIISPLVDTLSEEDFDLGSRDYETGQSRGQGAMGRKLK